MKFIAFEQNETGLRLLAKAGEVSVAVLVAEDADGRPMIYVTTDGPEAVDTAIFPGPRLMVLVDGKVVVDRP